MSELFGMRSHDGTPNWNRSGPARSQSRGAGHGLMCGVPYEHS